MYYKTRLLSNAILLFCVIWISGCFSSAGPAPTQLAIHELLDAENDLAVEELSKDPLLFRLTIPEGVVFATGLKQCGVKSFVPSTATTRELLVGFDNLKVLSQEYLKGHEGKILRSEFEASLDNQQIDIVSYTARKVDCVIDYAFWRERTVGASPLKNVLDKLIHQSKDETNG